MKKLGGVAAHALTFDSPGMSGSERLRADLERLAGDYVGLQRGVEGGSVLDGMRTDREERAACPFGAYTAVRKVVGREDAWVGRRRWMLQLSVVVLLSAVEDLQEGECRPIHPNLHPHSALAAVPRA